MGAPIPSLASVSTNVSKAQRVSNQKLFKILPLYQVLLCCSKRIVFAILALNHNFSKLRISKRSNGEHKQEEKTEIRDQP